MRKTILLIFFVIPFLSYAQTDILVLQKRGMHEGSYTVGDPLTFKTVYGQWFQGTIENLRHDTIYISGQAFHCNEIATILRPRGKGGNGALGATMIVAGAGFFGIGAVNGLLRKDQAREWYTTSGYIIGGVLVAGGILLTQTKSKYYNLGGKFKLLYLQLNPRK